MSDTRAHEIVSALEARGLPVVAYEKFDYGNALAVAFRLPDGTAWAARFPDHEATADKFADAYAARLAP